jgi:hypothetical protein
MKVTYPSLRHPAGDQGWGALWWLLWEQELDSPAAAECARHSQHQETAESLHVDIIISDTLRWAHTGCLRACPLS